MRFTMSEDKEIENNNADMLALLAKSAVGGLPIAGPLLSELVGAVIPNQRIDRLAKYIKELDQKVSKIPLEKINNVKGSEEFIDLVEEGFVQASRAISDERRKYISNIVANGISKESIELQESKYLLKILEEINDIEVIWLKYYMGPVMNDYKEFYTKHQNVLTPIDVCFDTNEEIQKNRSAIQKSYKDHLERLKLIKADIRFNRLSGLPEFDKNTGKPKSSITKITQLGKLLLAQIGIIDDIN